MDDVYIMQGDQYLLPFTLRTRDGTIISDQMVKTVVLNLGTLSRKYPGDVTYKDGRWYFPLKQRQTLAMHGAVEPQARVEFPNETVFGGSGDPIDVQRALNRGVIGGGGSRDRPNGGSVSQQKDAGEVLVIISAASVELEPYTLPIATEQTLGGVRAAPKTDEMTEAVGVDEDGKLWYKPGSGGGGATNAKEVFFDEDLVLTEPFGRYKPGADGTVTVPAKDDSLYNVVMDAFSEDKTPTVTQPSLQVTSATARAYEVGTSVSPAYSAVFNAGHYEYKPDQTGVTVTAWSAENNATSQTLDTAAGTFAAYIVPDGAAYRISVQAQYTDGEIPMTVLGKPYPEGQIRGGTKSAVTGAITGYRNAFYGTFADKSTPLASDSIRALQQKSGKALTNGTVFTVNVPVGAESVVIAYPATLRAVTRIQDVNGLNADITSAFTESSVNVEGAGGYLPIAYRVYRIDFAKPNDTANRYTVTV